MPFVGKEELNQLEANQAELEGVRAELARLRRSAQMSGEVATRAADILADYTERGVMESEAMNLAEVDIIGVEKARLIEELRAKIVAEEGSRIAEQYRENESPTLRVQIKKKLAEDGTLAGVEAAARADVLKIIRAEVLAASASEIETELTHPDRKAAHVQQMTDELHQDGTLDEYRRTITSKTKKEWDEEAANRAKAEIDADIEAGRPDYLAEQIIAYKDSRIGQDFRTRARAKAEQDLKDTSVDDAQKAIRADELGAVLAAKARAESEAHDQEAQQQKLLELKRLLEGGGIPVEEIEKDTRIVLYLGDIVTVEESYSDRYGSIKKRKKEKARPMRELVLFATDGDGRFRVDTDSFYGSDNPYHNMHALNSGQIIRIGHREQENGKETFVQTVNARTPLIYDRDTTNDTTTSALLPVCEMKIGENMIRGMELMLQDDKILPKR